MSKQFKSSPSGARHGGEEQSSEKWGGGDLSPAGPGLSAA